MSILSLSFSLLQDISLMCIHHILVILYPSHGKLVFFQFPAIVNDSVGSMNIFIQLYNYVTIEIYIKNKFLCYKTYAT